MLYPCSIGGVLHISAVEGVFSVSIRDLFLGSIVTGGSYVEPTMIIIHMNTFLMPYIIVPNSYFNWISSDYISSVR